MRYFIRVKIPSNKLRAKMLNNNQENEKKKASKETNKQRKEETLYNAR